MLELVKRLLLILEQYIWEKDFLLMIIFQENIRTLILNNLIFIWKNKDIYIYQVKRKILKSHIILPYLKVDG